MYGRICYHLALAVILFGTTIADIFVQKPPCMSSLSIPFDEQKIQRFDNGSILYDNLLYPPRTYWRDGDVFRGCVCEVRSCIRKCCPDDQVIGDHEEHQPCINANNTDNILSNLHAELQKIAVDINDTKGEADFYMLQSRNCPEAYLAYALTPESYPEDAYILYKNGEVWLPDPKTLLPQWQFCMDFRGNLEDLAVLVCLPTEEGESEEPSEQIVFTIGLFISVPFLMMTFLTYAIIPELRNIYGKTLMCYVACLISAYTAMFVAKHLQYGTTCVTTAYIVHFSFLASFFWLNVMCFDIWWTFGGFRSMQGSIKQRDRKKFILYSIYAWGSASVLTVICMIMDFVPTIPKHIIRPEFGVGSCWFKNDTAKAIYFYGPMGVTVVCNICLFILTALKILRHKKDTAQHLKTSESRRHDDNKQWFNLYLKLFIVMGINWSMEIISWLGQDLPEYIWYLPDLTNTLQGVIIFIIFVWKDKIKRLLLKRLGCENRRFMSRQSTRSGERSGSSRTCASAYPLQEKSNQYTDSYRAKSNTTTTEESDCL